jgi:hypothetical protein
MKNHFLEAENGGAKLFLLGFFYLINLARRRADINEKY